MVDRLVVITVQNGMDAPLLIWPSRVMPDGPAFYVLLVPAVAVVALAGLYAVWRLAARARRSVEPLRQFWVIARRLDLSWFDRWRLIRIASAGGLYSPITLLLSAATFSHYVERWHSRGGGAGTKANAQAIVRLRVRLFGSGFAAGDGATEPRPPDQHQYGG